MSNSSIYLGKPWLKSYPQGVLPEIEIPDKSLCQVFDESAARWKDKTAIIFYGAKMSYGELKDKVDRFANALVQIGVKKDDRVALLMLNCPQYLIAFYGLLKAGAIITPISPAYVAPEIKYQLEDSGAEYLITLDFLYSSIEKTGVQLKAVILSSIDEFLPASSRLLSKSILKGLYQKMALPPTAIYKKEGFYQMKELLQKYPPSVPQISINPKDDVISLKYTGGTTGSPKGVMVTHYGQMAILCAYRAFYPFLEDGKETFISYMPFYHIAGQWTCVLNPILSGQTQVIITNPDLDDIINNLVNYQATVFGGAPTIFELLKNYDKTSKVEWKKLKIVSVGADALNEATFHDWQRRTGVSLHDSYGMTETSGLTHLTPRGNSKIGAIGVPTPSTVSAILDPEKAEYMPLGEIGEIVVSGPQVCKGYWKKPDATKECEAMIDGVTWWRTGDMGFMTEDGYFHIYDRKRDLIKYKGLRVYAREVEEVLTTHPKIKEVGVVGSKDLKVGENVKAYVVLESDARGKLSETDIMEYCQDKLAHYKIPKIIELVGEIPKTDVGKVSRRELREMEEDDL
jgi:long-chain acyl-CoA synthetase